MEENGSKTPHDGVYSKRLRAGRRRTYFFDVRQTKSNDYYLTITESKKRFEGDGYERHKVFLYKEDFNKFIDALNDAVNHVKEDLLPDYDFDEFSRNEEHYQNKKIEAEKAAAAARVEETPKADPVTEAEETIETPEDPPIDEDELKWD